jgi:hypothetical protein
MAAERLLSVVGTSAVKLSREANLHAVANLLLASSENNRLSLKCFAGGLGVKGREDEMAGFGGGQCEGNALNVRISLSLSHPGRGGATASAPR